MTQTACLQICDNQNMTFAATENGKQCFCGHTFPKSARKLPDSACNVSCYDGSNCGGWEALHAATYSCSGKPDDIPKGHQIIKPKPGPPPGAAPYPKTQPCAQAPLKGTPTCNSSKPIDDRVADLVSRIGEATKDKGTLFNMFSDESPGVPELNIAFYNWWSEALHGVSRCPYGGQGCCFKLPDGSERCPTSFPAGITTGCSFNKTLMRAIGSAVGTEARVANNMGIASLTFWTPNVNIFRDPRWGRGQETPGEDPTLNSDYAEGFVGGFQDDEGLNGYLKASSCCKHYAAYSMEDSEGFTRHNFSATVSEQDLSDTYFPAFISCANRGRASGVMCSYNAVNGVPSCASKELLTDNLRDKWGFDGYVTSDCGAVKNVDTAHHYTNTTDATCKDTLGAGMDNDCGSYFGRNGQKAALQPAIDDGSVTEKVWQSALSHLLRVQMRLGIFDPDHSNPARFWGPEKVDTPAHRALALSAAEQGIVLVKNANKLLPFSQNANKSVAVIGPSADATVTMQSNYHGRAPFLISPSQGLSNFSTNVKSVEGCKISGTDTSGIKEAVTAASEADHVVMVIGLDGTMEGEGRDRVDIKLPGVQHQLIKEVADAAKEPVVLVVMSGGPVDISVEKANPKIGAILIAGYPGEYGGLAIANTIYGVNNPSGKLDQTWYPASYIHQCSMLDMNVRPNKTTGCPGRTYRFYTGPTVFKFGDGLSYTQFDLQVSPSTTSLSLASIRNTIAVTRYRPHTAPAIVTFTLRVRNVGGMAGANTFLAFVSGPMAGTNGMPLRSLRGYVRSEELATGETADLEIHLSAHAFAETGVDGLADGVPGVWMVRVNDVQIAINISA